MFLQSLSIESFHPKYLSSSRKGDNRAKKIEYSNLQGLGRLDLNESSRKLLEKGRKAGLSL